MKKPAKAQLDQKRHRQAIAVGLLAIAVTIVLWFFTKDPKVQLELEKSNQSEPSPVTKLPKMEVYKLPSQTPFTNPERQKIIAKIIELQKDKSGTLVNLTPKKFEKKKDNELKFLLTSEALFSGELTFTFLRDSKNDIYRLPIQKPFTNSERQKIITKLIELQKNKSGTPVNLSPNIFEKKNDEELELLLTAEALVSGDMTVTFHKYPKN